MKSIFYTSIGLLFTSITLGQSFENMPLHKEITHVQPYTGIVFWTDNDGALEDLGDIVQLEFSYMIPADIVSDSGVYNWSKVENILYQAMSRGHQCIFRFRYTYPGVTKASVPLYIRNRSDYTHQVKSVEGMNTYIPDWSNVELQRFTLEFFERFAEKYDHDPRLAAFQVGFGSYSEYHLYDGPFEFGKTFPTKVFQETFLKHLDTLMKQTPWSISIDAADGSMSPMESKPYLKDLNFGLFDDSFMHKTHSKTDSEYNRASWLFFGEDRWKTRIAGGEFSYYTNYDQQHVLDLPDGPHGRSFESFASQYHMSYIIGNDQYDFQSMNRIEQASMYMGYKFEILAFRSNGSITEVEIKNTGIAPLYMDAWPSLDGLRSDKSLKGLLPGESEVFEIEAASFGEDLLIESDKLVPGQDIEFEADLEAGVITSSVNPSNDNEIKVYPNPFIDELKLSEPSKWKLYSLQGEKLSNGYGDEIVWSFLPAGFYILEVGIKRVKVEKR